MEIGLFPLGIVLLPTEQVPLHIFEPRYRELIAECLEGEQPFGLVFADDDGLRRTGTLASVVEVVERFEDGRLNIVVEGGDRFRLLELTDGRSFHTGTVEPLADNDDPPDPADVTRGIGLFASSSSSPAPRSRCPRRTSSSRRSRSPRDSSSPPS